jgi:hypothetical protein
MSCKVLTEAELSWSPSRNEFIMNCDVSFKKPQANIGVVLHKGYFLIFYASTKIEISLDYNITIS